MVHTTKLFSLVVIIGLLGFCQIVFSQEPTTTGGTSSTQAPSSTEGTSSTQAPSSTGGTSSTQAPSSTGGTSSTQAPSSTGGTSSTQAPSSTEGTSSTQAPSSTEGTSSTQAPSSTGETSSTETPTTTTESSSTTTIAPSSTTTEPTTTLPPPVYPEKAFPHNIGKFRSLDNKTCIILDGAFEIVLSVPLDNSTNNETLVVPEHAYAEEKCMDKSQEIKIYWPVPSKRNSSLSFLNKIVLKFEKTKAEDESDLAVEKQSFFLTQISVSFPPDQFDGYAGKIDHLIKYVAGNLSNYATPLNSSYACNHEESIVGNANDGKEFQFQLKVANLKLEAYNSAGKDEFSPQIKCKADNKHPSRKGLIVGLSITVVLLVLGGAIGYYLWRRRQHAGYQRMDN